MNRRSALGSLFWKETRQILPLVWLQLGLGIVLQLLIMLNRQSPFTPQLLVIMVMPSLFALGVGAILVGQEREQRTLDWLRWMPIAPRDILRMKLIVGLVSLVVVWCLNLLVMVVFVLPQQSWRGMTAMDSMGFFDTGWEYHWPLQSLFLLAAGFATAWLFRSSLVSVLALIPLASLQSLLILMILGLLERTTSDGLQRIHWTPWIIGGTLVAFTLVLVVIGWRVGLRRLGAEPHGEQQRAWRLFFRNPWDATPVWTGPAHSVGSMLVWQFLHQHRTPLLGIAAMMAGALVLIAAGGPVGAARGYGTFMAATSLILLVTSWLGVLAFQGDALHERIRFLAERGVSPGKVWATRHVVPLSLLTVVLVAVLALLGRTSGSLDVAPLLGRTSGSLDVAPNFSSSPPVVLMMVFVLFFTYGISQFVGQIFRSATIAAIAAPVVAWTLLFYSGFLFTQVRASYWLLAIFVFMPWLATWIMMSRWMDGRLGWGFLGTHTSLLAVGMLLPLGPAVMVIVSQPTMPAEVRRQLTEEAERYQREYGVWAFSEPQELVPWTRDPNSDEPLPENRLIEGQIIRERWRNLLGSELEPLAMPASRRPVRFTPQWPRFLFGEATLARQALERDADSELQLQRYRETMDLIDTLIDRLRRSWRLFEQDGADLIEIWLVRELMRPDTRQHLGDELYGRLVRSLGDDTGRNAARRRAMVLSWARYRNSLRTRSPANQLGGYGWIGEGGSGLYAVSPYSRRRAADYLAWLMLQRLERHEGWDRDTQIQELAKYWDVPEMVYGIGLGGEFMRADDVHRFAMPVEGMSRSAPGSQWHAGWERVAKELADESS
jgi:hypothetical protein